MRNWKQWMGMGLLAMLVCHSAWASPILKGHRKEPELVLSFSNTNLQSCLWMLRWHLERLERVNNGYPDPAIKYDSDAGILWGDRPLLAPTRLQRLID